MADDQNDVKEELALADVSLRFFYVSVLQLHLI
jgi:hypothetical protein